MASYCGPLIAAACCTYWTSAWNSLARSLFSSSMSWARVSLRGVPRTMSAAVRGFFAAGFLAGFFGAGLATGSPLVVRCWAGL
jgi:hypothetical protein